MRSRATDAIFVDDVLDESAPRWVLVRQADRATVKAARREARRNGVPVVDIHAPLYAGRGRRVVVIGPARGPSLPRGLGTRVGRRPP